MPRRLPLHLALLCALALALPAVLSTSAHPSTQTDGPPAESLPAAAFGANLVVNGNAEAAEGSTGGAQVPVPGWTVSSGRFTAIKYGGQGGFPDFTSPGPPNRGFNFFGGGESSFSTAYQDIDLAPLAEAIDRGSAFFTLSGYLGGYRTHGDRTTLTALFRSADGMVLATVPVGPVSASSRNYTTGVFLRSTEGDVPAGTRSVRVQLQMTRFDGDSNDGYADDIALSIAATRPVRVYLPRVAR